MQETLVEQYISNIDLSNVAALHQKRTLAFVNHFVITTVQFLNGFMKTCEQKLMHFERKLEKVNATMVLLEAKLSSIPEVNNPSEVSENKENGSTKAEIDNVDQLATKTAATPDSETTADLAKEPEQQDTVKVKPEYNKFIKMVQVGVPLDAVKLKISLEGLDPLELDKILKK